MRDMTSGEPYGHLWRYALPLLLGNWLQLAYNAVDSIIAGRFIGQNALAAEGIAAPVMNLVMYGCIMALSWWGAHFIVGGSLTTGELASLFTYVMSILMSLMMLSMIFVMLTQSAASGRRVAEVIDEKADIVNPVNTGVRHFSM